MELDRVPTRKSLGIVRLNPGSRRLNVYVWILGAIQQLTRAHLRYRYKFSLVRAVILRKWNRDVSLLKGRDRELVRGASWILLLRSVSQVQADSILTFGYDDTLLGDCDLGGSGSA